MFIRIKEKLLRKFSLEPLLSLTYKVTIMMLQCLTILLFHTEEFLQFFRVVQTNEPLISPVPDPS